MTGLPQALPRWLVVGVLVALAVVALALWFGPDSAAAIGGGTLGVLAMGREARRKGRQADRSRTSTDTQAARAIQRIADLPGDPVSRTEAETADALRRL